MGLCTSRQTFAAGKDTGSFRLKEHYKQPKAKRLFSSAALSAVSCTGSLAQSKLEIAVRFGVRLSQAAADVFLVSVPLRAVTSAPYELHTRGLEHSAMYYMRG